HAPAHLHSFPTRRSSDLATIPSGTPTSAASPKPIKTLFNVATMLSISPRSRSKLGKLRTTSAGLGRMIGEISRFSACSPLVASRSEEHTSELQSPYDLVC